MSERASPRLLVCGFGPFPGFPDNPAALVVRRLEAERWSPPGATAAYLELPTTWTGAFETLAHGLDGADAVLLLGVASGAAAFRVEGRAANRARTDQPDAAGGCFHHGFISPGAPAAAARAPVAAMVAALVDAGLPADLSSDAGAYLCNFTFYRALTELPAAQVAFLHLPPLQEGVDLDTLERGVKEVAAVFAAALAPAQITA